MQYHKYIVLIALLWPKPDLHAQRLVKTILEQIAALKAYRHVLRQGYEWVEEGLQTVGAIRQAEWDLHRIYFESLKIIDPATNANPQIEKARKSALSIDALLQKAMTRWRASPWLSDTEANAIYATAQIISARAKEETLALNKILEKNFYQMDDGARINQIENEKITRLFAYTISLINDVDRLIACRTKANADLNFLK